MLSSQTSTRSRLSKSHKKIKKLLGEGVSQRQIAIKLNIPRSTLQKYIRNNEELSSVQPEKKEVDTITKNGKTTTKLKIKTTGKINSSHCESPEQFLIDNGVDLDTHEIEKHRFYTKEDCEEETVEKILEVVTKPKPPVLNPALVGSKIVVPKFKKFTVPKDNEYELILIISDLHIPFMNIKLWELFLRDIILTKPDKIIINGDFMNFDALARHDKKKFTFEDTQAEINEGGYRLWQLREACAKSGKDVEIVYIEGNHDQWLINYNVRNAPASGNLKRTQIPGEDKVKNAQHSIPELLQLDHFGIEWYGDFPHDKYVLFDTLRVSHRSAIRSGALNSPATAMKRMVDPITAGDTHRFGIGFERREDAYGNTKYFQFGESGCFCELNPEYMTNPDWANGYLTIKGNKKTNNYHMSLNHFNGETLFTSGGNELNFSDIESEVDLNINFYNPTY